MTDVDGTHVVPAAPARDILMERLNDPATVAEVLNALDVLPTLAGTLEILQGFYAQSEHILDNVRDSINEVMGMATASPLREVAPKVLDAGRQTLPLVTAVTDSGLIERMSDPALLDMLSNVMDAVTHARAEAGDEKVGIFSLAKALRDPDTSRGIDFSLRVMKHLGASLASESRG